MEKTSEVKVEIIETRYGSKGKLGYVIEMIGREVFIDGESVYNETIAANIFKNRKRTKLDDFIGWINGIRLNESKSEPRKEITINIDRLTDKIEIHAENGEISKQTAKILQKLYDMFERL